MVDNEPGTEEQEFDDGFAMTPEEQELLRRMEQEEPSEPPTPAPEPQPRTPEPPTPPEPPATPEPPPAPLPPGAEPPPIEGRTGLEPPPVSVPEGYELPTDREPTLGELARFVTQMYSDVRSMGDHSRGLRDDLIRERERRRVAEFMASVAPPAPVLDASADPASPPPPDGHREPGAEPATPPPHGRPRIPIVQDENGDYVVDVERLGEFMSQRGQQVPARPPGTQPGPDEETRNRAFDALRSSLIATADNPVETQQALDELRDAFFWMGRRVQAELPRVQNQVQFGMGLETIHQLLDKTGIGELFSKSYFGLDPMELAEVGNTLEPFKAKQLVRKYLKAKASRGAEPPPVEPQPGVNPLPQPQPGTIPSPSTLDQNRPRPMASRGRVAQPKPTARSYANMHPDDVLTLSEEEYREMERLALSE